MPVVFSEHAKKQFKERKITKSRVILTVENPDKILPSFKDRKLRQKAFGGTILEVVTKTEGFRITVITAYYL